MLRDLKLDVFYPYSPERVWQAITNRRVLAHWLMENDFEPRVGHKFRFQPQPHQGVNEAIHCEVIELDEPRSLSYTWRGGLMGKPTIVTWRLVPMEGGTQLLLEHKGFESHALACGTTQSVTARSQPTHHEQTWQDKSIPRAFLETRMPQPIEPRTPLSRGYGRAESIDTVTLNFYLNGGWHAVLNSQLQNLLSDRILQK
ncbi:MAG TPA: SRPBCC domain-containing protein [Stenomitos sp.]